MNGDQTPAHATPPAAQSPQDPNFQDIRKEIEGAYLHELGRLQKDWWWFLILGIVLVIGGTAAIICPWVMSFGVVIFIGAMLILSGVIMIISAFWVGKWSAFGVQILIGLLYIVAGYVITDAPVEALAVLTLMLAGFLVVGGGFRIVSALVDKYPAWGWSLLNGVISLVLGLVIFRAFRTFPEEPNGVLWIIGLIVGIEILFNGWTWIMLSLAIRKLPEAEESVS